MSHSLKKIMRIIRTIHVVTFADGTTVEELKAWLSRVPDKAKVKTGNVDDEGNLYSVEFDLEETAEA